MKQDWQTDLDQDRTGYSFGQWARPVVLWVLMIPLIPDAVHSAPAMLDLVRRSPQVTNSLPYKRWLWAYEERAYPGDEIPRDAQERMLRQTQFAKRPAAALETPAIQERWAPIGPAPILEGQTVGAMPVSGRVGDIAVDPSNPNHWLIGTALGGVWETLDAGLTWRAKSDDQAALAIGAIAFAASALNVVYAGTGDGIISGSPFGGAGMLKSVNGGTSWQLLGGSLFAGEGFSDIKVHPANPDVLVVATTIGIFKSSDGGNAWSARLQGNVFDRAIDLEADPGNFSRQYGALWYNGVYRSVDAGDTWSRIDGPWAEASSDIGRIELALAPSSPDTLFVSIHNVTTRELLGIWRTDNAWAATVTWAALPPVTTRGQLWYNHELIVDPANPSVLFFGEVDLWKYNGSGWAEITGTLHVDQHCMAWAGQRLIVGNDGGMWSSVDGGNSWINHNTDLQITQFYDGSLHPTNPSFALGGSQDNGTERWDGSNAWHWVFGGDGADNAISSTQPDTHWAISYQYLGIERTTNAGMFLEPADGGIENPNRPFIGKFEKAFHNDDVFIAGARRVWRCNNFFSGATPQWYANSPELDFFIVRALAFAPSDPLDNTYAFGSSGLLRLTTDGGKTWIDPDPAGNLPDRVITALAFHPDDRNVIYVCLSGFDSTLDGGGHVFKTSNALSPTPTWLNVTYPADVPAQTVVLDPDDPNVIYVGTDLGVWRTGNGGSSWTQMGPETGLPNVAVYELKLNKATGRLIAFTHGRGAFALEGVERCTPLHVDCRYSGNNPNGCPVRPFSTVAQAYQVAQPGETLRIFPCNYPETLTLSKPLRLEATNGIVNIGIP